MFPRLTEAVEEALLLCGRDRVFHNDGQPPSVAIRWRYANGPSHTDREERWIIGAAEGPSEGHDDAGRKAALAFANRLRERGSQLISWAEQIERRLKETKP
jgi:hypothetical protein